MRTSQEHEDLVAAYTGAVLDGRVPAGSGYRLVGKLERQAVERYLRDIERGPERGLRFNKQRARRALWWWERHLVYPRREKAGQPFVLEGWQAFCNWNLFGWEKLVDGRWLARFRKAYLSMARKNSKSTYAAGVGLLMQRTSRVADPVHGIIEQGIEVYSAATTRKQASLVWELGSQMVQRSGTLKKEIAVHPSRWNMSCPENDSKFEALAAESDTLDGLGPYCAIVDELHEHPDSGVYDVLESGMGSHFEPLLLAITTAGADSEGICWDVEQDAINILSGEGETAGIGDDVFAFICRIDEGDDPFNVEHLGKANPSIGVSLQAEDLRLSSETAQRRPSARGEHIRKKANRWSDESESTYMPAERWDACDGKVSLRGLRGQECWVGVDLSATTDTTAVVAVWKRKNTYLIHPWIFVPADTVANRVPRERGLFHDWIKRGLMEATPGEVVDFDLVWERIEKIHEDFGIREIAFDRHGDTAFIGRCEAAGIEALRYPQGFGMDLAMKAMEVLAIKRRLAHGGHEALRSQVLAIAEKFNSGGQRMPDKKKSRKRIDAGVAALMAVERARASQNAEPAVWRLGA